MVTWQIKITLDEGAKMPLKAHEADAGFDLFQKEGGVPIYIPPHRAYTFDTGVHMAIPDWWCGVLMAKSGMNVKHGITSTGLIDSGYTGSIRVKLYNHSNDTFIVQPGEKISQIIILPVPKIELMQVDELEETERGDAGFGSSGK